MTHHDADRPGWLLRIQHVEDRSAEHSERIAKLEDRLSTWAIQLAEFRKDLERLTDEVRQIRGILSWVGAAVGGGVLTAGGAALLWVIRQPGVLS